MYILFGQRGDQYSNPNGYDRWDILGSYLTLVEVQEEINLIKDRNIELAETIDWVNYSSCEAWNKRIVRVHVCDCKDIYDVVELDA